MSEPGPHLTSKLFLPTSSQPLVRISQHFTLTSHLEEDSPKPLASNCLAQTLVSPLTHHFY